MEGYIDDTNVLHADTLDLQHIQNEMNKLQMIRGLEAGTLHFVSVPRSGDQEYIDHSLLQPEYLTAHVQNGVVVNIIQSRGDNTNAYLQGTAQFTTEQLPEPSGMFTNETQVIVPNKELLLQLQNQQQIFQQQNFQTIISTDGNVIVNNPLLINQTSPKVKLMNYNTVTDVTNIRTTPTNKNTTKSHNISSDNTRKIMTSDQLLNNSNSKFLSPTQNLPHKKRISHIEDTSATTSKPVKARRNLTSIISNEHHQQQHKLHHHHRQEQQLESVNKKFYCEICSTYFSTQINFFMHLKTHYEPESEISTEIISNSCSSITSSPITTKLEDIDSNDINIEIAGPSSYTDVGTDDELDENADVIVDDSHRTINHEEQEQFNEFSDTEVDIMDGINLRSVVDKVNESIDNEQNTELATKTWYSNANILSDYHISINNNNNHTNTTENNSTIAGNSNCLLYLDSKDLETDLKNDNANSILRQILLQKLAQNNGDNCELLTNDVQNPKQSKTTNKRKNNNKDSGELPNKRRRLTCNQQYQTTLSDLKSQYSEDENDFLIDDDVEYEENGVIVNVCDKITKNKQKTRKISYKCKRCKKIYNSKNALHYHLISHTGKRPHQCDQCGKGFFARSALKVHMRLHSGDKPYQCDVCQRYFRQWGDLKYHMVSIHSTEKEHQCEFCGKDFARRYSLVIHRRIHTGEKNYVCEFCNKTFRASSYLQDHRKIHTGEKPHACTYCSKKFRVRGDLKRHINIHLRHLVTPAGTVAATATTTTTAAATSVTTSTTTTTTSTTTVTATTSTSTITTTITRTKRTTSKQLLNTKIIKDEVSLDEQPTTTGTPPSSNVDIIVNMNGSLVMPNTTTDHLQNPILYLLPPTDVGNTMEISNTDDVSTIQSNNIIEIDNQHIIFEQQQRQQQSSIESNKKSNSNKTRNIPARSNRKKSIASDAGGIESKAIIKKTNSKIKQTNKMEQKVNVTGKLPSSAATKSKNNSFPIQKCNICNQFISNITDLMSHITTHENETVKKCLICSKTYSNSNNLRKHLKQHLNNLNHLESFLVSATDATSSAVQNIHNRNNTNDRTNGDTILTKSINAIGLELT